MITMMRNNISMWDHTLCVKIFNLNGKKFFDAMMFWASRLGDGYMYGVIFLLLLVLNFQLAIQILPAALIAFAIEIATHVVVKKMTRRPRPFERISGIRSLIAPPDKFSFPSGHTAAAFLMATLFSFYFPIITVPVFLLAATIGFSRVYNGVHFPSDVLIGMLLGIISALIGLTIIR
ncbi:MAG TPA: phosphatase PAP2 family protein [bacterium]|nr:phosphatase PAP2 family protein [bacterium]HPN44262.1 phosphatase PAP2 family protein [bacterium]